MSRAERRHQLKQAEKRIAGGLNVRRPDGHDVVALMRVLHDRTQTCIEKRSVRPLMDFVYSNMTGGERRIASEPLACARGCSHCCHVYVEASAPEVLYTVGRMDPAQRASAIEAVEAGSAQTAGLSMQARHKTLVACPLLVDDQCSAYASRPFVCRTAVSTDAEVCRRAYRLFSGEIAPKPIIWQTLRDGYSVALRAALLRSGLPYDYREWIASLRIALNDPSAETRWLGGNDVFATVPNSGAPSIFTVPVWHKLYVEAFGSFP